METIKIVCRVCGLIFYTLKSETKEKGGHFCPVCRGKAIKWIDSEETVKDHLRSRRLLPS